MIRFLEGQVAVVTGASRGLGASTARLLASAGATTVLVARSEPQVQSVAADLAHAGHTVFPIATDIANPGAVDTLFRACQERFGRVDLVVNIAGTIDGIGKQSWLLEAQEWEALAGTNISGPFLLCRNAVPMMLRAGHGRILMLTSSSAERPTPMAGPYGATKAAVNQLVRAMAEELADTGVTINAFNPGPVKSPTLDRVQQSLEAGPWRRYWSGATRSPEDAAQLILWLCSPDTSALNGEVVFWNDPPTTAGVARFVQQYGVA